MRVESDRFQKFRPVDIYSPMFSYRSCARAFAAQRPGGERYLSHVTFRTSHTSAARCDARAHHPPPASNAVALRAQSAQHHAVAHPSRFYLCGAFLITRSWIPYLCLLSSVHIQTMHLLHHSWQNLSINIGHDINEQYEYRIFSLEGVIKIRCVFVSIKKLLSDKIDKATNFESLISKIVKILNKLNNMLHTVSKKF